MNRFAPKIGEIPTTIREHWIDLTDDKPVYLPEWRKSEVEALIIRKEVNFMLSLNLICPSNHPWNSLIVIAPKKDGTLWFCIDYRWLNAITKKNKYLISQIEDQSSGNSHWHIYIDDIIVFSQTFAQHMEHLNKHGNIWITK